MRRLLDEADEDRSGNLSFDEFSMLVQLVREGLAVAARRRQRVTATPPALQGECLPTVEAKILTYAFMDLGISRLSLTNRYLITKVCTVSNISK